MLTVQKKKTSHILVLIHSSPYQLRNPTLTQRPETFNNRAKKPSKNLKDSKTNKNHFKIRVVTKTITIQHKRLSNVIELECVFNVHCKLKFKVLTNLI
jgi:hypothetical protein